MKKGFWPTITEETSLELAGKDTNVELGVPTLLFGNPSKNNANWNTVGIKLHGQSVTLNMNVLYGECKKQNPELLGKLVNKTDEGFEWLGQLMIGFKKGVPYFAQMA